MRLSTTPLITAEEMDAACKKAVALRRLARSSSRRPEDGIASHNDVGRRDDGHVSGGTRMARMMTRALILLPLLAAPAWAQDRPASPTRLVGRQLGRQMSRCRERDDARCRDAGL